MEGNGTEISNFFYKFKRGEFFGSNIKYFGGFANDKMEGFGVMVYMNSDTEEQYYGSFKDNQKNGRKMSILNDLMIV